MSNQCEIRTINIYIVSICLFGFLGFSGSTIIGNKFFYCAMAFCLFISIILFFKQPHIDKKFFNFILPFILVFVIGLAISPISLVIESRFDYSQWNPSGRVANLILFSFIFMSIYQYSKNSNVYYVLKWYQVGVFILLITAVWHAISIYFGVLEWPFETRSKLHSTGGVDYSLGDRVTGIAREPSFFVMYAIDFIVLTFVFFSGIKKRILLSFSIFMLLLSLSPSGYVVLFCAFLASYIFSALEKFNIFSFIKYLTILFIILCFFYYEKYSGSESFEYIYNRIFEVDASSSGRLFMLLGPLDWIQDSSIISLLFGHGIKSFSIIGTYYSLPDGSPIHVTSNNLYVDLFWESGLVGLLLLVLYFANIFKKIYALEGSQEQRFIAFFVFFDLIFSAIFRADYASFRFFAMLYLLFLLVNHDLDDMKYGYLVTLRKD